MSKSTAMHGMPAAPADSRQTARSAPSRPRVSITVVSRRRDPAGDDLIEYGERIGRCAQIVLALADDGTQARRSTRSDLPRSVQLPTTIFPRRPDRSAQRGRCRNAKGIWTGAAIAQAIAARIGSGRDQFATIDFGTKHVVAQPESDTANGVDETQLWCPQLQLAAQVRQVNVDHVRVADPVRAPHLFEQLGAGADLGGPAAQLLEQCELDASDGDVVVANADLFATDIDGQWTERDDRGVDRIPACVQLPWRRSSA